jgi:hypothetical protein
MAMKRLIRLQMHPRLDNRLAIALRGERGLDCGQNFRIGQCKRLDVEGVQIVDIDWFSCCSLCS